MFLFPFGNILFYFFSFSHNFRTTIFRRIHGVLYMSTSQGRWHEKKKSPHIFHNRTKLLWFLSSFIFFFFNFLYNIQFIFHNFFLISLPPKFFANLIHTPVTKQNNKIFVLLFRYQTRLNNNNFLERIFGSSNFPSIHLLQMDDDDDFDV